LAALAKATGKPMTDLLDEALDSLERKVFFDALNGRYRELRAERGAWAAIEAEREADQDGLRDASA
jgi:hypothetical protein